MLDLDDARVRARGDPGGMLGVLGSYVDDFLTAYDEAAAAEWRPPKALRSVVIGGMGGSGISGNLVEELVRRETPVPIVVVKDYHLPAFVGRQSLVVAISYSGDTQETVSMAREAKARGATLVALSSGGRLERLARGPRSHHLRLGAGRQPRAALPELFGATLAVAHHLGLTKNHPTRAMRSVLESRLSRFAPPAPAPSNPAKRIAAALHDKFPYWYASAPLGSVALRGRSQLNENAKLLARSDRLPEGNHNELVAWNGLREGSPYFVGFLRQRQEAPEIRHRFEFLTRILNERGVAHDAHLVDHPSPLVRLLEALMLVDYTSIYTAILRGVDPSRVDVIGDLKAALDRGAPALAGPSVHPVR